MTDLAAIRETRRSVSKSIGTIGAAANPMASSSTVAPHRRTDVTDLDAAWAKAVAAVPDGWRGPNLCDSWGHPDGKWEAAVHLPDDREDEHSIWVVADDPSDALLALAAKITGEPT